jgi:tungstate transport system substrate-binding protein
MFSNGGAGATGLIRALAEDYLSTLNEPGSITWVCNHSRNTQLALLNNYIDLALTYERSTESISEIEGWSKTFGCVFHDHFVLAGPSSDPAGVMGCGTLREALKRINELGREGKADVIWHARNDDSATMWKERALWAMVDKFLEPWKEKKACESWYQMSVCTPAEAIQKADVAGAYLLTDRATLLCQTSLQTISRTTVFIEPRSGDDVLMNSCFALYSPDKERERNEHLNLFLEYAINGNGQGVIENFGVKEVGVPLFAGTKESFAKNGLRGGFPTSGTWVMNCGH